MQYTHINPETKKRECLRVRPECTFQEYIEQVLKEAGFRVEERDPLYNRVHLKGCLDIVVFWKVGSMQLFESREFLLFLSDITWEGWHFHRLGDSILETLRAQWKHHNA